MKAHLLLMVAVVVLSGSFSALAQESQTQPSVPSKQQACESLRQGGASPEQLAKSGCCSWHGGVCGCSLGRVTCCDGAFSPSCGCNKEDPPKVVN